VILSVFVAIILGYFFTQFAGYWIHRVLHDHRSGIMYRSHKTHHEKLYPPEDFLSKSYRNVPVKDRPIIYYGIAAVFSSTAFFLLFPAVIAAVLTGMIVFIAWLNDWIHEKIHIKGHWLEMCNWFWKIRELHFHHHEDEKKNIF